MTGTAQALTHSARAIVQALAPLVQAATSNGSGSWLDSLKYIVAGLAFIVSGPILMQELTEIIIKVFKVPFFAKPYVSHLLSAGVSAIMAWTGVDSATAVAAGGYLAGLTKFVNSSPMALDLENKLLSLGGSPTSSAPTASLVAAAQAVAQTHAVLQANPQQANAIAQHANAVSNLSSVVSAMSKALLLVLLLGVGVLRADVSATAKAGWCAGPSLFEASALWQADGASALVPASSALGGVQFTGYLGDWQAYRFEPTYYLGLLVGLDTNGSNQQPAIGLTSGYSGAGVFMAKMLGHDAGGLVFGVEGNLQFSGYIPFLYFGKPGN